MEILIEAAVKQMKIEEGRNTVSKQAENDKSAEMEKL